MAIFSFVDTNCVGSVFSVDTGSVIIKIDDLDQLRRLRVNQLIAIRSGLAGRHLIGIISKITRKSIVDDENNDDDEKIPNILTENLARVTLIGTLLDVDGLKRDIFKRTLDTVPEIDAKSFCIEGEHLTKFMSTISSSANGEEKSLHIGRYSLDENAKAFLDGNKLFQRHAIIVGSTGSGKSWCVARIIEQVSKLNQASSILFDIHGEYQFSDLKENGIRLFKVAGPNEVASSASDFLDRSIVHLPYWLLNYEEILSLLLDRTDSNAPNQAMLFTSAIYQAKETFLDKNGVLSKYPSFTVDSPIPYEIEDVIQFLKDKNEEKVEGSRGEKQGPYFDKLTRFIQRLESKIQDKRLSFLFGLTESEKKLDWMNKLCKLLLYGTGKNKCGGVKVIDFSEVPSDILPLMIGLVSRIVFTIQQWLFESERHPIALFCDEAHLYIPEKNSSDTISHIANKNFERIAKEGRKYGVGIVVISQRPSEVNKTVLSQCNNVIALRLTNVDDQSVIEKLLPDTLTGLTDSLPILDVGEAIIVGDASLLPTRVIIDEPSIKPKSATIPFWNRWSMSDYTSDLDNAIDSLRKQSKSSSIS